MNPEMNWQMLGYSSEEEYQASQMRQYDLDWEEWETVKHRPFSSTKVDREDRVGDMQLRLSKAYPQFYFHENEVQDFMFGIPVVKYDRQAKEEVTITLTEFITQD